jgi:hypothetical protein
MATFSALYDDALHTELGSNDTSVLFTTAKRKAAINEGMRQFADLTECYVKQSTINTTNGTQEFNLNSSVLSTTGEYLRIASQGPVYQVSDSNGLSQTLSGNDFPQVSVPYLDNAQSGWRSTATGIPTGWYLRNDGGAQYFGLNRIVGLSTGSTQTAKVILPYVVKPSSMTADTAVPFTDTVAGLTRSDLQPYHQALAHYGAYKLELLRKDKEASKEQLSAFMGYVQRYKDQTRPRGNRVVRAAVSYFRNARGNRDRGGVLVPDWPPYR